MATFSVFNKAKHNLGLKVFEMETDTFNAMLITDTATDPVDTATDPTYGSGGNPDFTSDEVTAGGNYSAGGKSIGAVTWTESGGTVTWNTADDTTSWAVASLNPTDARHCIVYDTNATNGEAVGWFDLGQIFDMSAGTLTLDWHASNGLFQLA